ncbi:MAG: 2-phospho-L-lactate transferase [Methanolobus sp.]|jgi:LPPG:FO 2-phospho-L-lactate transferase|uniref:2-phospho-L-lactate transferase n=1 Tax=Methanolobus tindarius DSM 2278 TaxID=1090322 RepID=W9DVI1_METTI|nr:MULTISPECIES: 2-phospho-L-lactate transferase [Methanolobus]ETA67667.1 LPPG:FO 2-phospho-L-lactate transferase [Methanolobus tindarius DSM 2278]MDK2832476.1 2-phospho-L-lactate transferase [Methanolobus sp.]
MIIFSGGTGTPKLMNGLREVYPEEKITVVVNTAEDIWVSGNLITPDIDTVLYLLSGRLDTSKWWGVKGDTYLTHNAMKDMGYDEVMMLGDIDRATHIMRSDLIRSGLTLTEAIIGLSKSFGVKANVFPMSDDSVSSMINTPEGKMHFQDFWVGKHGEPEVLEVCQEGIEKATISPAVVEALEREDNVLIGPSNPITSIGPIIELPGMRDILKEKKVIAVSPIIGTEPVSGPAGKLMTARDIEVSSYGVASYYSDFLDHLIIDERDPIEDSRFKEIGCSVSRNDTLMKTVDISRNLAETVLRQF